LPGHPVSTDIAERSNDARRSACTCWPKRVATTPGVGLVHSHGIRFPLFSYFGPAADMRDTGAVRLKRSPDPPVVDFQI
jgi:hypothetical protein